MDHCKGTRTRIASAHHFVPSAFARDQRGSISIFALILFSAMLLAAGMAVDFMRYEDMRSRLQYNLDRAVLAAAALNQELDAELVVNDYMAKSNIGLEYTLTVQSDSGMNFKTVSAQIDATLTSMFLNMVGISTLSTTASGTAQEGITNVEISLITDISGSMGGNSRLPRLKAAAKEFVDTVLTDDSLGNVSLSLVPYSGQTNAGANLLSKYNVNKTHSYSNCIDFEPNDFTTIALSPTESLEQMQHYYGNSFHFETNTDKTPFCRTDAASAILPLSMNRGAIKAQIDALTAEGWTGMHFGLKWGLALLDPSAQPVVSSLIVDGDINAAFEGRPNSIADGNTLKFAVLMTDGEITKQKRVKSQYYNNEIDREYWSKYGLDAKVNVEKTGYYGDGTSYTYWEWEYFWEDYTGASRSSIIEAESSTSTKAKMMDLCDAARNQGITLFTIGFEVNNKAATLMENCATTPSHFYRVDGLEIEEAFDQIASTISKLKLVQ